jgi:hypothetical protein
MLIFAAIGLQPAPRAGGAVKHGDRSHLQQRCNVPSVIRVHQQTTLIDGYVNLMKQNKTLVVAAIGLCLVVMVACGPGNAAGGTTDQPAGTAPESNGPVVASEWGLRGEGSETTEMFDVPAGAMTVEASHAGSGPWTVELVDGSGNLIEEIVSDTGATAATRDLVVNNSGRYALRINADGAWEIAVSYPDELTTTP